HGGQRRAHFSMAIGGILEELGELPLPPYITDFAGDGGRYQTVYSRANGSVAAPTAGLHFTPELLGRLRDSGVGWETITLHVGLDTFGPVTAERVADHRIHREWAELTAETAEAIRGAKEQGGRVFAVGTTSTRVLEYCATTSQAVDGYGPMGVETAVVPYAGEVDLFIYPGYRFRAVDALLTNFHLPRSSLLMLVSAFVGQGRPEDLDAGRQMLLRTYEKAKAEGYRFYSFGDAMLIL
ncbi:MAG: tRNA preQ1(34) S-adenosylmethionine ribosyltransferase-isomerase QueA, partial [Caldilineaceae bacterium SB0665_bin_25]|nr:tRNA preQ1(34) S-adenosylmethionine ribosyltransferase-isomerase QueA [Caldilineaceae bacterium SB0665_bin_25]